MTDAQKALDDLKHFWLGGVYDRADFTKNNEQTLHRALRLLAAVEAGTHKVVPVEPSDEMADAGGSAFMEGCYKHLPGDLKNSNRPFKCYYRAMLQAAPDFFGEDGK